MSKPQEHMFDDLLPKQEPLGPLEGFLKEVHSHIDDWFNQDSKWNTTPIGTTSLEFNSRPAAALLKGLADTVVGGISFASQLPTPPQFGGTGVMPEQTQQNVAEAVEGFIQPFREQGIVQGGWSTAKGLAQGLIEGFVKNPIEFMTQRDLLSGEPLSDDEYFKRSANATGMYAITILNALASGGLGALFESSALSKGAYKGLLKVAQDDGMRGLVDELAKLSDTQINAIASYKPNLLTESLGATGKAWLEGIPVGYIGGYTSAPIGEKEKAATAFAMMTVPFSMLFESVKLGKALALGDKVDFRDQLARAATVAQGVKAFQSKIGEKTPMQAVLDFGNLVESNSIEGALARKFATENPNGGIITTDDPAKVFEGLDTNLHRTAIFKGDDGFWVYVGAKTLPDEYFQSFEKYGFLPGQQVSIPGEGTGWNWHIKEFKDGKATVVNSMSGEVREGIDPKSLIDINNNVVINLDQLRDKPETELFDLSKAQPAVQMGTQIFTGKDFGEATINAVSSGLPVEIPIEGFKLKNGNFVTVDQLAENHHALIDPFERLRTLNADQSAIRARMDKLSNNIEVPKDVQPWWTEWVVDRFALRDQDTGKIYRSSSREVRNGDYPDNYVMGVITNKGNFIPIEARSIEQIKLDEPFIPEEGAADTFIEEATASVADPNYIKDKLPPGIEMPLEWEWIENPEKLRLSREEDGIVIEKSKLRDRIGKPAYRVGSVDIETLKDGLWDQFNRLVLKTEYAPDVQDFHSETDYRAALERWQNGQTLSFKDAINKVMEDNHISPRWKGAIVKYLGDRLKKELEVRQFVDKNKEVAQRLEAALKPVTHEEVLAARSDLANKSMDELAKMWDEDWQDKKLRPYIEAEYARRIMDVDPTVAKLLNYPDYEDPYSQAVQTTAELESLKKENPDWYDKPEVRKQVEKLSRELTDLDRDISVRKYVTADQIREWNKLSGTELTREIAKRSNILNNQFGSVDSPERMRARGEQVALLELAEKRREAHPNRDIIDKLHREVERISFERQDLRESYNSGIDQEVPKEVGADYSAMRDEADRIARVAEKIENGYDLDRAEEDLVKRIVPDAEIKPYIFEKDRVSFEEPSVSENEWSRIKAEHDASRRVAEQQFRDLLNKTPEEIKQIADEAANKDKNLLIELFGSEAEANKYERLQRRANSTTDVDAADEASRKIEEMESKLTDEQRNKLYGIGERGLMPDDYDEISKAAELAYDRAQRDTPQQLKDVIASLFIDSHPDKAYGNALSVFYTLVELRRRGLLDMANVESEIIKYATDYAQKHRYNVADIAEIMPDKVKEWKALVEGPSELDIARQSVKDLGITDEQLRNIVVGKENPELKNTEGDRARFREQSNIEAQGREDNITDKLFWYVVHSNFGHPDLWSNVDRLNKVADRIEKAVADRSLGERIDYAKLDQWVKDLRNRANELTKEEVRDVPPSMSAAGLEFAADVQRRVREDPRAQEISKRIKEIDKQLDELRDSDKPEDVAEWNKLADELYDLHLQYNAIHNREMMRGGENPELRPSDEHPELFESPDDLRAFYEDKLEDIDGQIANRTAELIDQSEPGEEVEIGPNAHDSILSELYKEKAKLEDAWDNAAQKWIEHQRGLNAEAPKEEIDFDKIADESENLSNDEIETYQRLVKEFENYRQDLAKDIDVLANTHGYTIDWTEPGKLALRAGDTNRIIAKVNTPEELKEVINKLGEPNSQKDLDGGDNNNLPPDKIIPPLPPSTGGIPHPADDLHILPTRFVAKVGDYIDTRGVLTGMARLFQGIDSVWGTHLHDIVFRPMSMAIQKVEALKLPWYNRVMEVEEYAKKNGVKPDRIPFIIKHIEAFSTKDIDNGYVFGRKPTQEEIDLSNTLAQLDPDFKNVYHFYLDVKRRENKFKRDWDGVSPDAAIGNPKMQKAVDEFRASVARLLEKHALTTNDLKAYDIIVNATKRNLRQVKAGLIVDRAYSIINNTPNQADFAKLHNMTPAELEVSRMADKFFEDITAPFGIKFTRGGYYPHFRVDFELDPEVDVAPRLGLFEGLKKGDSDLEFKQQLVRLGVVNAYEMDLFKAMRQYISAGFDSKIIDPLVEGVGKQALADINANIHTGARDGIIKKTAYYLYNGVKHMATPVDKEIEATWSKFVDAMGMNNEGFIRKYTGQNALGRMSIRDLMRRYNIVSAASFFGLRPMQGVRDYTSAVFERYYMMFGHERMLRMMSMPFEVDPKSGERRYNILFDQGKIAGLAPDLTYSSWAEAKQQQSSGSIGNLTYKLGRWGLKTSGQDWVYKITQAGAYLDTYDLAMKSLKNYFDGKINGDKLKKILSLNKYSPAYLEGFFNRIKNAKGDATKLPMLAEDLAQQTVSDVIFQYGNGNAPYQWGTIPGRAVSQFGYYPVRARSFLLQALSRGTPREIITTLRRFAMVEAAQFLTGKVMGVSFRRWALGPSIIFMGGPMVSVFQQMQELSGDLGTRKRDDALASIKAQMDNGILPPPFGFLIPGGYALSDWIKMAKLSETNANQAQIFLRGFGVPVDYSTINKNPFVQQNISF